MDDGAVFELDCDRLIVQFHQKPIEESMSVKLIKTDLASYLTSFMLNGVRVDGRLRRRRRAVTE